VIDFTDKLWAENLETKFKTDVENGKVPVALLMNTGEPLKYSNLNICLSFDLLIK